MQGLFCKIWWYPMVRRHIANNISRKSIHNFGAFQARRVWAQHWWEKYIRYILTWLSRTKPLGKTQHETMVFGRHCIMPTKHTKTQHTWAAWGRRLTQLCLVVAKAGRPWAVSIDIDFSVEPLWTGATSESMRRQSSRLGAGMWANWLLSAASGRPTPQIAYRF